MKKVLLYIWQLPQNIIALIVILFLKNRIVIEDTYKDVNIYGATGTPGSISLGNYIILSRAYFYNNIDRKHEYGHHIQSVYLGPLYLFIIGIPSIIWASLYGPIIPAKKGRYYKFYTEKWADKLEGIKRA